jgi:hypothetical protein
MSRRCWTCNSDHELDEACAQSMRATSVVAAGGRIADDLFETRERPVFLASYRTEDSCCGEGIRIGDRIRSDGDGGWIHEDCEDL